MSAISWSDKVFPFLEMYYSEGASS